MAGRDTRMRLLSEQLLLKTRRLWLDLSWNNGHIEASAQNNKGSEIWYGWRWLRGSGWKQQLGLVTCLVITAAAILWVASGGWIKCKQKGKFSFTEYLLSIRGALYIRRILRWVAPHLRRKADIYVSSYREMTKYDSITWMELKRVVENKHEKSLKTDDTSMGCWLRLILCKAGKHWIFKIYN